MMIKKKKNTRIGFVDLHFTVWVFILNFIPDPSEMHRNKMIYCIAANVGL